MKQIVLLMLLIGGAVLGTQAQGRHGYNNHGYARGYRVHGGGHYESYRGAYYGCRPAARVVYVRPRPVYYAPAPAVVYAPVPPPPAPVVYARRPRVVINAGIVL